METVLQRHILNDRRRCNRPHDHGASDRSTSLSTARQEEENRAWNCLFSGYNHHLRCHCTHVTSHCWKKGRSRWTSYLGCRRNSNRSCCRFTTSTQRLTYPRHQEVCDIEEW